MNRPGNLNALTHPHSLHATSSPLESTLAHPHPEFSHDVGQAWLTQRIQLPLTALSTSSSDPISSHTDPAGRPRLPVRSLPVKRQKWECAWPMKHYDAGC